MPECCNQYRLNEHSIGSSSAKHFGGRVGPNALDRVEDHFGGQNQDCVGAERVGHSLSDGINCRSAGGEGKDAGTGRQEHVLGDGDAGAVAATNWKTILYIRVS